MSQQEKNQFDQQIKIATQKIWNNIRKMQAHFETNSCFMESVNSTQRAHKQIAIVCLIFKYQNLSKLFLEFKLWRKKQKELRSSLLAPKLNKIVINKERGQSEKNNFDKQTEQLLRKYESPIQVIKQAQSQIEKIYYFIKQMQNMLMRQNLTTEQILKDAKLSLRNIQGGNKSLVEANEYAKSMGKSWTLFFIILSVVLLTFDFLKS